MTLTTFFGTITDNISSVLVPALLVAIGAVVVVGLTIFGAKYGIRLVKSFFGMFAK
jgi:hypothetical protein